MQGEICDLTLLKRTMIFNASMCSFSVVCKAEKCIEKPIPLFRDDKGKFTMQCISPIHGRSYVVGMCSNGHFIISKGNGLSYSTKTHSALSKNKNEDLWGLLKESSALRDYYIGQEVATAGIRTNRMEYVLRLEDVICNYDASLNIIPFLLQYDVICPYRISDFHFMPDDIKNRAISSWEELNEYSFHNKYLIAAYVLIKNLYTLREHHILHNALHAQNYTWALELLDFEASRTDNYPFENLEYESWVSTLADLEIVQTYEVINYIAWCLKENIDTWEVRKIFKHFKINEL